MATDNWWSASYEASPVCDGSCVFDLFSAGLEPGRKGRKDAEVSARTIKETGGEG